MWSSLVVLWAACGCAAAEWKPPEAAVLSGRLVGKRLESRRGRGFAAFEGIPYATPPLGQLRFQAPRPAEQWASVYNATKPGPMCTQRLIFSKVADVVGEEDCLYLNVYVPEGIDDAGPLHVLFYVHGGGWAIGSGDKQNPQYILDHDVILVTINYRLGPLGFLSTQDDVIPGNYGLKDQVQALRWVQQNIAAFRGNPESVTIIGHSSGGAAVHMLTLSPLAKGLFHKAIAMSGNALMTYTFAWPGEAKRSAARLAELLQCPATPSQALRKCLLTKSHRDITGVDASVIEWDQHVPIPFKVVAERSGPEAFIDRHPRDILLSKGFNDVPLMIGMTSHEGSVIAVGLHENDTALREFDGRFSSLLPLLILWDHLPKPACEKIREFYFGGGPITHDSKQSTINLMSDATCGWPTIETVRLHAKYGKSSVYFYEFAYKRSLSFAQTIVSKAADYGVCHVDDLPYIFPIPSLFPASEPAGDDVLMSEKFVNFIVSFAKTGRPSEESTWRRVSCPQESKYLHIGARSEMRVHYAPERIKFWEDLSHRFGYLPSGHDEL